MQRFRHSTVISQKGIDHFVLHEKTYYDTGYVYGKLLRAIRHPSVRVLNNPLVRSLLSLVYMMNKKYFGKMRIPQDYLDELRGYADGSGVSYHHLFALNFVFDVLKKYGFHCSTFAFFNKNSTIVGRNTDLIPLLARIALRYAPSIVVTVSIPGKKTFTHITPPLCVGAINGFNDAGIAVNSHQILCVNEKNDDHNIATPLLMRKLLEETETIADAKKIISANIPRRSLNILVTSAHEQNSMLFEINPSLQRTVSLQGNHLCTTTHFEGAAMAAFHTKSVESSKQRLASMYFLLKNKKTLSVAESITILQNSMNGMDHRESGRSLTNDGTYQSFVFDLTHQKLHMSNGRKKPVSLNGSYVEIGGMH